MKHIIAVLLENEPGALSRVVGLFSARGYNIESLTVAPTEDATLSRMTIGTSGSYEILEQSQKQRNSLSEAVKVGEPTESAANESALRPSKVGGGGEATGDRDGGDHGRHIDFYPARCTDRVDGTERKLCAGGERGDRIGRSHFHARRSERQPGAGPVDVHGGDERDIEHREQRD